MNYQILTAESLAGRVRLPASKSYSIRAFLTAALGGNSLIIDPSNCDDALVACKVMRAMGAKAGKAPGGKWRIEAGRRKSALGALDVGESGTVLRLAIPLVAARGIDAIIDGSGTLKGRPNGYLVTALRAMGADVSGTGPKHSIPVRIKASKLSGGDISLDGSLSSQFVSALLMACPLLEEDSRLSLKGRKLVSTDYITMTLQILERAGIKIRHDRAMRSFIIKGRQVYGGLKNFTVPSDYGLAAFPLAAGALVPSRLVLEGYFNDNFVQADGHIIGFLQKMGVAFSRTSRSINIKGPFRLKGGRFSLKNCPDLVPIMAVLALFADKKTELVDIGHARAKESDRISDLRAELLRAGADVRETATSLSVYPKPHYRGNVTFDPHSDHRLAMAFTVLGLKIGAVVKDMGCTAKSYPDFVRDMRRLGARFRPR